MGTEDGDQSQGNFETIMNTHGMTKEELSEYVYGMFGYEMFDYQMDFAHSWLHKQEIVAVFCRQTGKTTTTARLAVLFARLLNTHNPICVFAPSERQASIIAAEISRACEDLVPHSPFKFLPKLSGKMSFRFNNGARIICQTTGLKGEKIRGFTSALTIMEEASYIPDFIVKESILPMGLATRAKIIKIGTPSGRNHFYDTYKKSVGGNRKVAHHKVTCEDGMRVGLMDEEYVNMMKEELSEDQIKTQLYAEFIDDQDAYFKFALINSCISQENFEYEDKKTYYLGVDVARLGKKETAMIVVQKGSRKEPHKVVEIKSFKQMKSYQIVYKIQELDKTYQFEKIYVDETGVGGGTVDYLKTKYGVYEKNKSVDKFEKVYDENAKIIGVTFTLASKLDIYSNLKVLMERGKLKFPEHRKLISQLADLRYEETPMGNIKIHAPENGYDDLPDALALACRGLAMSDTILDLPDDNEKSKEQSEANKYEGLLYLPQADEILINDQEVNNNEFGHETEWDWR